MVFALVQVGSIAAVAAYFVYARVRMRRRNSQSWEALLARLRPDWSARELSDHFLWKEGLDVSPEDAWQKMQGPRGLWVMFKNAGVMLEMADFAAKHTIGVDPLVIATLRSDAMQIRLCVLMSLTQYGFTQASEGVRVNAYRAATMYASMAARMTALLQEHAAVMVPDFVAAM